MYLWYNWYVIIMNNILFICYGNICRSPMAEMIFKDLVRSNHKTYMFTCKSRALSMEELGNDIYPDAKKILELNNVTIERHYAKKVSMDDLNEAHYVIVMEQRHRDDLIKMFPNLDDSKVYSLLDGVDIEDPWYTNNFKKVYELINKGCNLWFTKLIGSDSNEI